MPVHYTLDTDRNIIFTEATGPVTVSEISNYLEALLVDDRITFGSTEVFSLVHATDLHMSYSEMGVFGQIWLKYREKIGNRVIIIAPDDISYGMFRMLATVVSFEDPDAEHSFTIVRSDGECRKILDKDS